MPESVRTAPRENRVLVGPALTFSINDEVNRLKQEPEWISGSRNSVTLVNTANLSIVLDGASQERHSMRSRGRWPHYSSGALGAMVRYISEKKACRYDSSNCECPTRASHCWGDPYARASATSSAMSLS